MSDQLCVYAKVYGERNAGTNFVAELLRRNFAVHCLQSNNRIHEYVGLLAKNLPGSQTGALRDALLQLDCQRTMYSEFGWKHGIPPRDHIASAPHARQTLFVCVAKHPVAWLQSLARRPYNLIDRLPGRFSRFIRHDWTLTRCDNLAGRERINVVELWNVKNAAFRDLESEAVKCLIVAYEEILRDPAGFLASVANHLIPRGREFVWSFPSTKKDEMTFDEYKEKYAEHNFCRTASADDLEFIRGRADRNVMEAFGYRWPAARTT